MAVVLKTKMKVILCLFKCVKKNRLKINRVTKNKRNNLNKETENFKRKNFGFILILFSSKAINIKKIK